MKNRAAALLLSVFLPIFLLVPPWAVQAASPLDECAAHPNIPVNVTPRFDEPAYDHTRDIPAIQAMAAGISHGIHESLTLGLTRYEPVIGVSIPVKGIKLPSGLICAHADSVDITVGYKDVTVYIAREVADGSCGYVEIMAHEQKHIAVNRQILEAYLPRVQDAIADYVRAHGTFREETEEYAMGQLRQGVQALIAEQMAQLEADNHALQQRVDTPEEYKRITYACNGELAHLTLYQLNGGR